MGMLGAFNVASARFLGLDHEMQRRNYQDYSLIRDDGNCTVYAVSDGAGGGVHNEVGSALGLEILATLVMKMAEDGVASLDWAALLEAYVNELEALICKMTGMPTRGMTPPAEQIFLGVASQFLTHTVVLCVMDEMTTQIVRFGDGYAGFNGYIISSELPGDEHPAFPVYALYRRLNLHRFKDVDWDRQYHGRIRFEILLNTRTADVQSFMVGTDGLRYIARNEHKLLPGRKTHVGPLVQFMIDEKYCDPQNLENRLSLIGMPHPLFEPGDSRKPDPGYLLDDVAVIVGHRKEAPHEIHGG